MDHKELCEIAGRWLKKSFSQKGMGCQISFTEPRISYLDGESPDAIGFRVSTPSYGGGSTVVECKTSLSDFLADQKKSHRQNEHTGMGRFRYYMCPEGLIAEDKVPDKWGLLYVGKRNSVKVIRGACLNIHQSSEFEFTQYDTFRETLLLANLLHRVGDPEKVNARIRNADRVSQNVISQNERLREQNSRLLNENMLLDYRLKESSEG